MNYTHLQLEEFWSNAGGPLVQADVAAAIAQAESGGNPDAIDNTAYPSKPGYHAPSPGALPEFSVGLWQINMLAHPSYTEAELLDPLTNARAAVAISDGGINFRAWSTYTSGAYLAYLTGTTATSGTPTPAPGLANATSLGGWHQVNLALARHMPAALLKSERLGRATASNLARHRR